MRKAGPAEWRRTIYRRPVSSGVKVLLLLLADYMDHDRIASIPRHHLADMLGVGEAEVKRRLAAALQAGLLTRVHRGQKGVTAVYQGVFSGSDVGPTENRSAGGYPDPLNTCPKPAKSGFSGSDVGPAREIERVPNGQTAGAPVRNASLQQFLDRRSRRSRERDLEERSNEDDVTDGAFGASAAAQADDEEHEADNGSSVARSFLSGCRTARSDRDLVAEDDADGTRNGGQTTTTTASNRDHDRAWPERARSRLAPQPLSETTDERTAEPLPDDWAPNRTHRARASKLGLDMDVVVAAFLGCSAAYEERRSNWDKTFGAYLNDFGRAHREELAHGWDDQTTVQPWSGA